MKLAPHVIFDLDNCLADDAWRIPLIDWTTDDMDARYDRYHAACGGDRVGNLGVLAQHRSKGHTPVFMTARPTTVMAQTRLWIEEQLGLSRDAYILLMRNVGDHRRSFMVKEDQLAHLLSVDNGYGPTDTSQVVTAYDDRRDIVAMYRRNGVRAEVLSIHGVCAMQEPPRPVQMTGAAAVLSEGAKTFAERNAVYGSNYKMVAPLMRTLFPQGVPSDLVVQDHFHLFELMLVKLSRFAISNLTHQDSVHDLMVYAAMVESIIKEQQQ